MEEERTCENLEDWFYFCEEDLEDVREWAAMGEYPETAVKLIEESIRVRKLGNKSESVKLLDLALEDVEKWKAAKKNEKSEKSNSDVINFDDSNFSELSEHDLALIRAVEECENSHKDMTFEEFKEIEDFLFGETDCDDIDFSETEKQENFTPKEWLEWKEKEKQRIESLERAIIRKSQKK